MFGFDLELISSGPRIPFNKEYRCYSVSMMPHGRNDVENGGKIILPPSALDHLTRLNTAYPMLFKLSNSRKNRFTHCGVLEFVAEEGRCYIPNWMMRNLLLEEGNIVRVQSATLPVASFSKFEPQSSEFLDITNPKAVLENALRNFACLTAGDIVAIRYNDRVYELRVLETRPGPAVSIIECDMDVDFAPPPDYVEPIPVSADAMDVAEPTTVDGPTQFRPFVGSGNRLDGKAAESVQPATHLGAQIRGIPDYEFQVGQIHFFHRRGFPSNAKKDANDDGGFKAFEGKGLQLKPVSLSKDHLTRPPAPSDSLTLPPYDSLSPTPPSETVTLSPHASYFGDDLEDTLSFESVPIIEIEEAADDILNDVAADIAHDAAGD